jgi:tripartite-type tricarboxylate transporter receptor subunit TctC
MSTALGMRLLTAALSAACAVSAVPAHAQTPAPESRPVYPVKVVRIILPFAEGGTGFVGRWVALKLTDVLGQSVVVDPRPGAGGNIGFEAAAKAAPDGYTLVMGNAALSLSQSLYKRLGYDPARDFTPIAMLGSVPNVLVVHPSVPAQSLRQLVLLARKQPGKLAFGSSGVSGTPHLSVELLKSLTGIDILHVPYKGAYVALVGLLGGEVDMVVTVPMGVAQYIKQGKLRALATLAPQRSNVLPEVPTTAEAGLPQLVVVNWYALLAPAGTPREIIDRLNMELVKIMKLSETRERFASFGADPTPSTPQELSEFLRADTVRWAKVIKDAGIPAE